MFQRKLILRIRVGFSCFVALKPLRCARNRLCDYSGLRVYLHGLLNCALNKESELSSLSVDGFPKINFFTIVLNGLPFLRYHIEIFRHLRYDWHWHIVEGVASLNHDTAWSVDRGGRIPPGMEGSSLSTDGTSDYLDTLGQEFPSNVTIYRKPSAEAWDGKIEMIRAPLENILEPCLLWQIDVDELWTSEQIAGVVEMFRTFPAKTAAYFLCHFFVTDNMVTASVNTYGNNLEYEWLRVWRFVPGAEWLSHEPPRLCLHGDPSLDLAKGNVFSHLETATFGLVFQHFAYAIEAQIKFKEDYYGYRGALTNWKAMKCVEEVPFYLRDYFPWVSDDTKVLTAVEAGVEPLFFCTPTGDFEFRDASAIPPAVNIHNLGFLAAGAVFSEQQRLQREVARLKEVIESSVTKRMLRWILPAGTRRAQLVRSIRLGLRQYFRR